MIRFIIRLFLIFLLLITICFAVVHFYGSNIIKFSLSYALKTITGIELETKTFNVGIIDPVIDITGLKLMNPKTYRDRVMMDMPRVYARYDLKALLKGKVHFYKMILDCKDFHVVKKAKGVFNTHVFRKFNRLDKYIPWKTSDESVQEEKEPIKIAVDDLEIRLGIVYSKDYSKGDPPKEKKYKMHIDASFIDLDDAYPVVENLISRTLKDRQIANITGVSMQGIEGSVSGAFSTATSTFEKMLGGGGEKREE